MKRLSIILMACLMVLGLSQCKKENQNASTEPEGVKITLNVDNGGERVAVTPGETVTTVTFEDGDVILVADDQHYLGSLSRTNGAFTGTVTQPGTDHLHFFFAGNKVAPSSLTPGTSTGCTVDMSDQSDGPAVVSYASMAYDGSSSVTANVKLMNKASGLMKFTTSEGTTNDITISGVYNKINITFSAEPTIATDQIERGTIKLNRYTGDTENKTFLAIIPEQVGVENVSVSVDGFTAENIEITAVEENTNSAVSISLTAAPSHEYVDLGLPSGTLWATCNVGADSPEGYGDYFAWGETTPKDSYDWSNYQHSNNGAQSSPNLTKYCNNENYGYNKFTDNLTTLEPEDDAATANWGSDWRMPTYNEWDELLSNTTHTWTTQNGVKGRLFTATNGNSLFLPAAGIGVSNRVTRVGTAGLYSSSSLNTSDPRYAWYIVFISSTAMMDGNEFRFYGTTVRAVRKTQN